MKTIDDLLADYFLTHELASETTDYYRRMVGVLCAWACRRIPLEEFGVDLVNQMLLDKQRHGLSPSYRKSLRSAMRALLSHHSGGPVTGKLRPVKVGQLEPQSWTAAEVRSLIEACQYMRDPGKRTWWRTIIAVGYYTGFSNGDLWRLRQADVRDDGIVTIHRSKTGKRVTARIPEPWLSEIRKLGTVIWGLPMAKETFRQTFKRIVRKAGLSGSFKRLRKSCGTSIEMRCPGRGHIALGNTRAVFERHYFSRQQLDENPPGPDALP